MQIDDRTTASHARAAEVAFSTVINSLKLWSLSVLAKLVFAYPPVELKPERMRTWLNAMKQTSAIDGHVVEIGVYRCGTAIWGKRFLQSMGCKKKYFGIDTFSGFDNAEFEEDVILGNVPSNRCIANINSLQLAKKILELHSVEITLIRGSISKLNPDELPEKISSCLIDVDLAIPTYYAMQKIYPRISTGGLIVIDDCSPDYFWQARKGVERFCAENALNYVPKDGCYVVRKEVNNNGIVTKKW